MARVLRHTFFSRPASAFPHRLLREVGAVRAGPGLALAAALVAATLVAGFAGPARAVTAGLSFVEVTANGGSDFPDDLYNSSPDEDIYAISRCGPCGESDFDLFDGTLGKLRSVRISYDGYFWGDAYNSETRVGGYYRDMGLWIEANHYHVDLRDLLSEDWADLDFSGAITVSDESVSEFVYTGHGRGYVDFFGNPQMNFESIEQSRLGSMGADYTVTVLYGYTPVVAPVPLPPAALLMLGSLGAVFAASRRRSGSAA